MYLPEKCERTTDSIKHMKNRWISNVISMLLVIQNICLSQQSSLVREKICCIISLSCSGYLSIIVDVMFDHMHVFRGNKIIDFETVKAIMLSIMYLSSMYHIYHVIYIYHVI